MSFLSGLIASLAIPVLNWIHGKVSFLLTKALEAKREREKIRLKNRAIREKTEAAETKEERREAARDTFNNW